MLIWQIMEVYIHEKEPWQHNLRAVYGSQPDCIFSRN